MWFKKKPDTKLIRSGVQETVFEWTQNVAADGANNMFFLEFIQEIRIEYIIQALLAGSVYTYYIRFPQVLSNPVFNSTATGAGIVNFNVTTLGNYFRVITAGTGQATNMSGQPQPFKGIITRSMFIGSANAGGHSIRMGFTYVD